MFRFVSYVVIIGGGLFLLCACAQQGHPTLTPTDIPLSARTPAPTHTPLPAPTDAALPSPPSAAKPGLPSAADLAIQVPTLVEVVPDETTIYTLTIRNHGPDAATGIVLTDVLPEDVFPVWTQRAQPLCSRQEGNVTCDMGHLQGSDATTVTLDLSVGGTEPLVADTQLVGVTVDLSAPTCAIDQDAAPSHLTCRLNKLPPGADVQVHIGVSADAQTTSLGLQSLVHTATVAADETDPDRLNNRATATMMVSGGEPVPTSSEPVEGAMPTMTDLVVQADGSPSFIAGQPVTYTFTITNQGALDATDVRLEYVVPPATILNAYTPGLPSCHQRDDVLTCLLRDLDNGNVITFTLVITGHGGQPMIMGPDPVVPGWPACTLLKEKTYLHIVNCELGMLKRGQATQVHMNLIAKGMQGRLMVNTASVSANEPEWNPLDNTSSVTATVQVASDLLVSSAISGPALSGKTMSYTLTVVNNGPSFATYVVLTDTLPAGTRLVSAISSQEESCLSEGDDASPDTVVCDLGILEAGQTAAVTIVVAVDESLTPALAEMITHSARVVAEQADPNPSNNELTESIPVGAGPKE